MLQDNELKDFREKFLEGHQTGEDYATSHQSTGYDTNISGSEYEKPGMKKRASFLKSSSKLKSASNITTKKNS